MKRLICVALLAVLVLCCLSGFHVCVHAQTSVGGLITSDTTWTPSGSPYVFAGAAAVVAGVTLTIEPGTVVNFAGYYLEINGTLDAQGTSSSNIIFDTCSQSGGQNGTNNGAENPAIIFEPLSTSWNSETASGSIVENVFFNTASVYIQGCSPEISRDTFDDPFITAINIVSGSPLITNNVVNCQGITGAIIANGGSTVTNNMFNGTGYEYLVTVDGNASLSNNVIEDGYLGAILNGQVNFEGNTVIKCSNNGISMDSNATIEQNYIADNRYGITDAGAEGTIEGNTIIGNTIGLQISGSPTIMNNNIYGNTQNNIYLTDSSNVDAANNWWGTTDTSAISQSIYDSKDSFTLGAVTYLPILTQPSSEAPSNPIVAVSLATPQPSNDNSQSTATPTPYRAQSSNAWQSSIGSGSSGPENSWESAILQWAKIAIVGVAAAWVVVALVFVGRRIRKK